MSLDQSVSFWITQLKDGDSAAAQKLWELYFQRLVNVARRKLEESPRAAADEEDVALSAFKSFCVGARNGRFTSITDRSNLWPLLVAITANKSVDLIRYQNREKRGGTGASTSEGESNDRLRARPVPLSEILSSEPEPEFAAQLAEDLQRLLEQLAETGDGQLREIALRKMDGEPNVQIAEQLGCTRRTVERKLRLIASLWSREAEA